MAKKPDLSEERKSQILDAAMETFSRDGFYKTRMSDIAETSGLSKGSLYWYFESKDSIILALLERVFEPELEDFRNLLDEDRSVVLRLHDYVDRAGSDIVKMLKWMPLVYDFIALAFRQEVIKKAIMGYYKQNMQILTGLIQQGIDSGEIQVDDAEQAAIALGSILEGTILLWFYDPDQIDIQKHIRSNTNLLLNGLLNPKLVQQDKKKIKSSIHTEPI
jgi:AcrR family transcriptional regulator